MAKTIDEVRSELAEPARAKTFAAGFAADYFGQAFGALPKSEIDLLVFRLLMDTGVLTRNHSLYDIARCLNVTPAKARNLLFQHQLRTMTASAIEQDVLDTILKAKFGVDGGRIGFGVESPLVRAAVVAKAKANDVFPDVSLTGETLFIPMNQIGDFIAAFLPADKAKKLVDGLRRKKVVDPDDIAKVLNKVGEAMIIEAAKAGGKAGAKHLGEELLDAIRRTLEGADVDIPEGWMGFLDQG